MKPKVYEYLRASLGFLFGVGFLVWNWVLSVRYFVPWMEASAKWYEILFVFIFLILNCCFSFFAGDVSSRLLKGHGILKGVINFIAFVSVLGLTHVPIAMLSFNTVFQWIMAFVYIGAVLYTIGIFALSFNIKRF